MRVGIGPFAEAPSGMAVATADTALALLEAGVDVTLFAEGQAKLPPRVEPLRDRVVRMAPRPAPLRHPRVEAAFFLPGKLRLSRSWARALAEHPVDVVHVFSPGTAAALPRGTPVVVQAWFHPPRLPARMRWMMRFARSSAPKFAASVLLGLQSHISDELGYRRASIVLANTATAAAVFRERGIEVRQLPPGIVVPGDAPAREPSDTFRIVFCAERLDTPLKGLTHLLDALPLLSGGPVEVTLFGRSSSRFDAQIEAARRAGIRVNVAGYVPREHYLEQLAHRTDMLAFTSFYEEWGYALLEAFSQGVPALAFDTYPFFEIVDDRSGVLVPPGDARAIAAAIDAARTGTLPEAESVLGSVRERFGSRSVVERLVPIYEQLAAVTPAR